MKDRGEKFKSNPEITEKIRKRSVEITTTRNVLLGKEISVKKVTVEKLEYVDLEDEGLKEKVKKILKETPSIPAGLQNHAETFISEIYADAKDFWNPVNIGDMEGIQLKSGYRVETDDSQSEIGKSLKERNIKPKTLLRLCNNVFSSPEGENNKDFQQFLQRRISIHMGLEEKREDLPKDESF